MSNTDSAAMTPATPKPSDELARRAVDRALEGAPDDVRKAARDLVAPWAEKLVRVLDDTIRIPGTNVHIGLDPILGFFLPGAGDVVTGVGSISLLLLALKQRVPTIVILRMLLNIGIDTLVGIFPIVGDAFDMLWRSNRRNLDLIEKYKRDPTAKPTTADYLLVSIGIVLAIASIVIPIVIVWVLGVSIVAAIGGLLSS